MPILNWSDCEQTRKAKTAVPFRLLKESQRLSYGDKNSGNLLIQGDNLHALKALLPYYRGQVKCIVIDPPYNTKSAFEHYSDSLEHSKWLDMIFPRLQLLRDLLSEEGSIWVTIDDNEAHYLKVIMDEIFGRGNFVANCIWQKKYAPQNDARWLSDSHDYITCYAKNKETWRPYPLPRTEEMDSRYKNPDNDPRGIWKAADLSVRTWSEIGNYAITTPTGRIIYPPASRAWVVSEDKFLSLLKDNRIWFGKTGNNVPALKKFLSEVKDGTTAMTIWSYHEVGHNQDAKKEIKALFADDVFQTPKPERLIKRVLELATQENDLVLDSFLGSGTTAAVAHKMNRRYIGIEMGEHAKTHCAARLKKVVDGEQGGISKAVGWQGGGGFSFYQLGAELFTATGEIYADVRFTELAAYIWFYETHTAWQGAKEASPLLGVHNGIAYYLLYNGILKDKSEHGGNILTKALLKELPKHKGKKVIYALESYLDNFCLHKRNIKFHPIPQAVPNESEHPRQTGR